MGAPTKYLLYGEGVPKEILFYRHMVYLVWFVVHWLSDDNRIFATFCGERERESWRERERERELERERAGERERTGERTLFSICYN